MNKKGTETFPIEWERAYSAGEHRSIWPWSDLVSYVMRYAPYSKKPFRVLELGCGMGANIPLFERLGAEYYGIEGSASAVRDLRKRFPGYAKHIVVGDFTTHIPFNITFDLVVDRASLTHNTTKAIQNCIELVEKCLASDGLFIGIDWFSTRHSDFQIGREADDRNTRQDFQKGQFKNIGKTHFSDKEHIALLFKDFAITKLEHKVVTKEIPHEDHMFASWNFIAQKKPRV